MRPRCRTRRASSLYPPARRGGGSCVHSGALSSTHAQARERGRVGARVVILVFFSLRLAHAISAEEARRLADGDRPTMCCALGHSPHDIAEAKSKTDKTNAEAKPTSETEPLVET